MKTFAILFSAILLITGCSKNSSSTSANNTLKLSSASVELGQYETVLASGNISGTLQWSATPSSGVTIANTANNAAILFTQSGTYTVTAKNADNSYAANAQVIVSNTVYVPGAETSANIIPFASNDKVLLTPVLINDSMFALVANTSAKYNYLNAGLALQSTPSSSIPIDINFSGVDIANTISGQNTALAYVVCGPFSKNGTYNMQLCDVSCYMNSFTVSDNAFTFSLVEPNGNIRFTTTTLNK
jgi:hypothetical protein